MVLLLTLDLFVKYATISDMTNTEKFAAIVERLKAEKWMIEENMISVMVIISYFDTFQSLGIAECPFNMTPIGKNAVAICEEFDWQPTDEHINQFITQLVEDKNSREPLTFFIKEYRDNREEFLDNIDRFKQ